MVGRNVNIYFQEKTYEKVKKLVTKRKISSFVNQAVEEKLEKERKVSKQELKEAYQRTAKSKKMRAEDKVWEGSIEDGIEDE